MDQEREKIRKEDEHPEWADEKAGDQAEGARPVRDDPDPAK